MRGRTVSAGLLFASVIGQEMKLEPTKIATIKKVLRSFESGRAGYGAIATAPDGRGGRRQVSYGIGQATEDSGSLAKLLKAYVAAGGMVDFGPYFARIGKQPAYDYDAPPLASDAKFLHALKLAATDSVMVQAQERFFDENYFQPARKWAEREGFEEPLSMLVIYDSFIQSGGILWRLRARFAARTPRLGGDEREWIRQYVAARDAWLGKKPGSPMDKSRYRTQTLRAAIEAGNWGLDQALAREV